jgi:hypothetical protein
VGLGFVQMRDWDCNATYDEMPPTCIHYRIEWKLMINKTVVSKHTEEDIVLEPTSYGPHILLPCLEEVLKRKVPSPRSATAEDTDVTVKVAERSEDDFVTQYAGTNIDWLQVERRLLRWSEWFRKGKKLRVIICFRYVEVSQVTATNASKTSGKRARGSATQQMQAELTTALDAEQAATGRAAAWQHVYALFRCPGPPCELKPFCWFDSQRNKRFGLKSHHLRSLIRYKDDGKPLDTHDQMPKELRQQIYKEERQSEDHKQTKNLGPSSGMQPIQITNILPSRDSGHVDPVLKAEVSPVEFSGLRDDNVQQYCEWQQSKVKNPSLKAAFQKATDFVIEKGLDLELLHEDQNPQFLIEEGGIPLGVARRYYRDIKPFAKRRKVDHHVHSPQQDWSPLHHDSIH